MPRDANGNYQLPAGNPVITGTTIEATWANPTMDDIAQALTESLSRNGQGGMLAPFLFSDGSEANPAMAFTNEPSSGFYRSSGGVIAVSILGGDVARFNETSGVEVSLDDGTTWSALATLTDAVRTKADSTIENDVTVSAVIMPGNVAVPIIDIPNVGDAVTFGDATLPVLNLRGVTIALAGTDIDFTGNVSLPTVDQLNLLNDVSITGNNLAGNATIHIARVDNDDAVYLGDVNADLNIGGQAVVVTGVTTLIAGNVTSVQALNGNLSLSASGNVLVPSPLHTTDEFGHTIRDYASPTAAVNWSNGPMAYLAIGAATTITFTGETLSQRGTIILDPSADAALTWPAGAVWVGNPVDAVENGVPTIVNAVYDKVRAVWYLISGSQCSGSVMALAKTQGTDGAILKSNGGFSSVVRNSTGRYTFTLLNAAPDANYMIVITPHYNQSGGPPIAYVDSQTTTGFVIEVQEETSGTSFKDADLTVQAIVF